TLGDPYARYRERTWRMVPLIWLSAPGREELDQVDLGHDRRYLVAVLDDCHLVLGEQLAQARYRSAQRDHAVDGLHHRADRLLQLVAALEQRLQQVHLVQHGDGLVAVHHWKLGDAVPLHQLDGDFRRIGGLHGV